MVFTDAVMEVRLPDGDRLGVEGILELLHAIPEQELERVYPRFVKSLLRTNGGDSFEDDLTLLLPEHQA